MENHQILMKEKLGFFGIIKEALKIPSKNPFIILTLLTSLPLFCIEIVLQQTIIGAIKAATYHCDPGQICLSWERGPIDAIENLIKYASQKSVLLGLLCLGIGHLLDLLNTINTVHSASKIYSGHDTLILQEMLWRPFKKVGFKGPFLTSVYVLVLSSLTLTGLVSLGTQIYIEKVNVIPGVLFGIPFIALLTKYMEWSAIWNTGQVISILEEKHGDVALGVSAYISRGSRKRGLLVMSVFFVWKLVLRLSCLFQGGWDQRGSGVRFIVITGQLGLVCFGDVMKWVVFTVYFYDCKKRFLEKKVDVEQGRAAERVEQ